MSKSIDQRIVEMQFNNRQFESGVKQSLGSIKDLENGLQFKNAHKGLNNLQDVSRKFSLAGIAESVDTIANRFTTLGIIGVTTLQRITNSAITTGKNILSSLTMEPLTTGFQEFELKMGSVQTIMAGSGESLEVVNEKLNELNKYSDLTIYSFSDMTTNIGKFTNAGVKLDRAVNAIMGISNAAALSGANANEASRAMYNFAQAISSGFVKLIDWKSIELANMATVEFKNQLLMGAAAAGTLTNAGDGLYRTVKGNLVSATRNFNDSLQDQWMTAEVLIDVLNEYADETTDIGKRAMAAAKDVKTFSMMFDTLKEAAQSGWAETWEVIIGDYEEGKKLWTGLADVIGAYIDKSADARNETLSLWKELEGRENLLIGIRNMFNALGDVLRPIGIAFRGVFPATTGKQLADLTERFMRFTSHLKMGEETANNIKNTFGGLFAILDIGKQIIMGVVRNLGVIFDVITPGGVSILKLTGMIGEWLIALDNAIKKGDVFYKAFHGFATILQWVDNIIDAAITNMIDVITSFKNVDTSGINKFAEDTKKNFEPLNALLGKFGEILQNTMAIFAATIPFFYKLASAIGNSVVSFQEKLLEALNADNISQVLTVFNQGLLAGILVSINLFVRKLAKTTLDFTGILDDVRETLTAYQSTLKAGVLLKIAISIGILAAALVLLASIDPAKLTASLAAISVLFIELAASMAVLTAFIVPTKLLALMTVGVTMVFVSTAVLILAGALKKLEGLDWGGIEKGLIGLGGILVMLISTSKALSANSAFMIRGSASIILFALGVNILASAVRKLGSIDAGNLTKGLMSILVILKALTAFMKANITTKMAISQATGILVLATALNVLSVAVRKLGGIDLVNLAKGLISMGVILGSLALFMRIIPNTKGIIAASIGLTILGGAMLIFTKSVEKMGGMNAVDLAKGLLGMAGALAAVVIAASLMPPNMVVTGIAMIGIATAMVILSKAINNMGDMTWEQLAIGLIALAGSLTILAVATTAMSASLIGAAAMVVISVSLIALATALKIFSSLSLTGLIVGLVGMAGAFAVIAGASVLLAPLIPVIFGLGAAIAVLGVGVLAAGAGLSLFAAGLAALAVAGVAGTTALIGLVTSLIGLIPFVFEQIAVAITAFAQIFIQGMPVITSALGALFAGIIKVVGDLIPSVIKTVLGFILELLKQMVSFIPEFVDTGLEIITGFLRGISENISDIVTVGIDVVLNFLSGIAQKLPDIINMAFIVIVAFINGLADAIRKNSGLVTSAIGNLVMSILIAIGSFLWMFPKMGIDIVKGLISGIVSMGEELVNAAKGVVDDAIRAAKNLLGIKSPSKVFEEIGGNVGKGLAVGIDKSAPGVEASSGKMTKKAVTAAEKAAKKTAKAAAKAAKDAFDASKSWIDDRKYYNELSLREELEAWERIQKRYLQGTEERKKADKEVYRVKKEMAKADFDDSKSWIDDRKYYNELSLYEELNAWERIQKRYLQGTEERKKADKEVYRVRKEIAEADKEFADQVADVTRKAVDKKIQYEQEYYDATKQINDKLKSDIQMINDEYDNALKSRTKALYNTYGLFDKIDVKEDVDGLDLINNLQDQISEFEAWTQAMDDLSAKGVDSALIDELQQMGPKSLKEIQALNRLSGPELDGYVSLWQTKSYQAKSVAMRELEGLRAETISKIQQLNIQAEIDLEEQRRIFEEKTTKLAEETAATIENLKNDWLKKIGELRTKGEKDFKTFAENIQTIMSSPDWAGVGRGIVDGMSTGVMSEASRLADAAVSVAMDALAAVSDALGIASPSKEFAKLGKYSSMGFAEGLKQFGNLVVSSASDVGTSAISALKKAISNISEAIVDNVDTEPVIRPVIDLTDIEAGGLLIDELLSRAQGLNLSDIRKKLPILGISKPGEDNDTKLSRETIIKLEQNNYSPKALSRLEIYRQTRNQLSTLKGVVGIT